LVGRRLAKVSYRVCASARYLQSDATDLAALTWIAPDEFLPITRPSPGAANSCPA
jgi:hypothetical protein